VQKKGDILALTKSRLYYSHCRSRACLLETFLNIDIDQEKVFIAPICNVFYTLINRKTYARRCIKNLLVGTFIPLHELDNILQTENIERTRSARDLRAICLV